MCVSRDHAHAKFSARGLNSINSNTIHSSNIGSFMYSLHHKKCTNNFSLSYLFLVENDEMWVKNRHEHIADVLR